MGVHTKRMRVGVGNEVKSEVQDKQSADLSRGEAGGWTRVVAVHGCVKPKLR